MTTGGDDPLPDPPVKKRRGRPSRRAAPNVPKLPHGVKGVVPKIAGQAVSSLNQQSEESEIEFYTTSGQAGRRIDPRYKRTVDGPSEPLDKLFGPYRDRAVRQIAILATKSRDEAMKFAASRYILDRTDGPIPKEVTGAKGQPLLPPQTTPRPSLADLLGVAVVAAAVGARKAADDAAAAEDDKTIDGETANE